ncbi:MAG: dienelactone hydrolase family protein [Acidimicrobiia bacterium]
MAVLPHEGTYPVMYGSYAVPVGAGYRRGYLARPDRTGVFPSVIVVPDLDGVTSHERAVCRGLARRGVAAVSADLYDEPVEPGDAALDAYHHMDDGEALRTIDEVHDFLLSDDTPWAHADLVGVLGLDVGGRFAIVAAAHRPWVAAVGLAYTPLTGDEERRFPVAGMLGHVAVPLLGVYAADDSLIAVETVDEAQRRNPSGDWLLYEGTDHGFLDGAAYNPGAAADAMARFAEFFLRRLPPARLEDVG